MIASIFDVVKVEFASSSGYGKYSVSEAKAVQGRRVKFLRKPWMDGYARVKSEENPPVETTKSSVESPRDWPSPYEVSSDQRVALSTLEESLGSQYMVLELMGSSAYCPVPIRCYTCISTVTFKCLIVRPDKVTMEWKEKTLKCKLLVRVSCRREMIITREVNGWVEIRVHVGIIVVVRAV